MQSFWQSYWPGKKPEKEWLLPAAPAAIALEPAAPKETKSSTSIKTQFSKEERDSLAGVGLTLRELPAGLSTKTKTAYALLWGISVATTIFSFLQLNADEDALERAENQLKQPQFSMNNDTCAAGSPGAPPPPKDRCEYQPAGQSAEFRSICDELFKQACYLSRKPKLPAVGCTFGLLGTFMLPFVAYNHHLNRYYALTKSDLEILTKAGFPKKNQNGVEETDDAYAKRLLKLARTRDFQLKISCAKDLPDEKLALPTPSGS